MKTGSGGKYGSAKDAKLPKTSVSHVKGGNRLAGQKASTSRGTK